MFLVPLGGGCVLLFRFAVFFHTDQSNNDWGFKLTSSACVSAPEELDEDKSEVRNRPHTSWQRVYYARSPRGVLGGKTMPSVW